jgi:hypothetical protein
MSSENILCWLNQRVEMFTKETLRKCGDAEGLFGESCPNLANCQVCTGESVPNFSPLLAMV